MAPEHELHEAVRSCDDVVALFALFRRALADEGVENIAFCRLRANGSAELPLLDMPAGFMSTYLANSFFLTDPILRRLRGARTAFYWSDIEDIRPLGVRERDTLEISRELGVHSGLSIPFHGPDRQLDFFSFSLRGPGVIERARMTALTGLTYQVWMRYCDLISDLQPSLHAAQLIADGAMCAHLGRAPWLQDEHRGNGHLDMTARHCAALVIVDIAARRLNAGLSRLSDTLTQHCTQEELEYLQSWGLITEFADDDRWRYYLAPTALGRAHLATCPDVPRLRRSVWQLLVNRHELPAS